MNGSQPEEEAMRRLLGPRLPITPAASVNQSVTNNTHRKKERKKTKSGCHVMPQRLKHSYRTKDRWILNKPFKTSNGRRSLRTKEELFQTLQNR